MPGRSSFLAAGKAEAGLPKCSGVHARSNPFALNPVDDLFRAVNKGLRGLAQGNVTETNQLGSTGLLHAESAVATIACAGTLALEFVAGLPAHRVQKVVVIQVAFEVFAGRSEMAAQPTANAFMVRVGRIVKILDTCPPEAGLGSLIAEGPVASVAALPVVR